MTDLAVDPMGKETTRKAGLGAALGAWSWLAVVVLWSPAMLELVRAWRDNPYGGHGALVPVYAAFVAWTRRQELRAVRDSPEPFAPGILLAALALLILGFSSGALAVKGLSLVVAVAGVVLWMRGRRSLRVMAFPVAFLAFMLPLPGFVVAALSEPIRVQAARITAAALIALGIPSYQEGTRILLPNFVLHVAPVCDGLRFLAALATLAAALAQVLATRLRARMTIVLASVPLAVAANVARVGAIALGSYWIGPGLASGWPHHLIGKGIWGLAAVALLGLALRLRRVEARAQV